MKKLEKSSLNELAKTLPKMSELDQKSFFGGGLDDYDCAFEALGVLSGEDKTEWATRFVNIYGIPLYMDAMTQGGTQDGISIEQTKYLASTFWASVEETSFNEDFNFVGSGIGAIGFLGSGHAVNITSVSNGNVYYWDEDQQKNLFAPVGDFHGGIKVH